MAQCKKCFADIPKGTKKSDHVCDTVKLNNGHIVRRNRTILGGDLYPQIQTGELKVMEKAIADPVRSIGETFKKLKRGPGGAVLLGKDQDG